MKKNSFPVVFAMLLGFVSGLWAQNGDMTPVTRTFALTNVNIVQQPGEVIEMGTIVVKDGLIHAAGKNVAIPGNAKVLDADSMFVYAGFIEALSHTGVPRPEQENNQGRSRWSRPEGVNPGQPTNEQAGIAPQVKVSTVLSTKEKSIAEMRELGFTTAHVVPEGRMLPGQGAIILLSGDDANAMVLRDQTSLFSQLAGASGVYPNTVIAVMSKWRELYRQAQQAQAHETVYKLDPKGMPRPEYDPALQAFYPVLDGELPVFFAANDVKDIHRVLMLKEELGFPLVLAEVKEGWHAADRIKQMNIPVLLSLDLPDEPKKDDKKEKEGEEKKEEPAEKTMADKEKEELEKRRAEQMEKLVKQAALMKEKGIDFGFSTLDLKSKDFKANLRRMIEKGLNEDQALAALTTVPAQMLGLSSLMGTVEPGKIANLVVSTGPYFDEDSNVRYVFVDGTLYEYEVKKKKSGGDPKATADPVGSWSYSMETPQGGYSGVLAFTKNGAGYAGTMSANGSNGALELSNVELAGNTLTFSMTREIGGQSVVIDYELVIDGDSFDGTAVIAAFGSFEMEIEGSRTPNR